MWSSGAPRSFDADGFFTIDSKAARGGGRPRILSPTFGNGVPTRASFAEALGRLIPGSRVFNLGVPGHSSYQGLAALELLAALYKSM